MGMKIVQVDLESFDKKVPEKKERQKIFYDKSVEDCVEFRI